ncbi:hypothetical protein ASPWEDRAFT_176375 [Aspergillus wentii DTO 134E9]|uniref:Protein kinase domain-containing protein n=1 Tax=Aspergillus wentii DTO 134E9 TaxID=1073089 RepID=A0A1L9R8T0_ASPWE|nr:uncharacterized protein ASPWEDRAFT_176375 [Aspergillus wentii DTO 134E9]OJJ31288.1 hypothetical protein ASPWEDRAFT_176375 [Aspergillus wentii DTO 134E9]
MERVDPFKFPAGSTLKKFENTIFEVGEHRFRPTRILSENWYNNQRKGEFEGENVGTGEAVIVKLRVETDPFLLSKEEQEQTVRRSLEVFRRECRVFEKASPSGYTPRYITHTELEQDDKFEFPSGYLGILVLAKYYTNKYPDIVTDATRKGNIVESEMPELIEQFEDMAVRRQGIKHGGGAPVDIEFDTQSRRLYMVDPFNMEEIEPHEADLADLGELRAVKRHLTKYGFK